MATPTCESCGARIEPANLTCPFCNAVTPFGLRHREQEERARGIQQAAQAAVSQRNDVQARALAQGELERLGRQSMIWSIVGFVLCCLPVPSLVALVLAFRARAVAREKGFVFPAQGTVGILLSIVTVLMSGSFYVFAGVSAVHKQQRIHALESLSAPKAGAETLDHDTACQLVEIYLLQHGLTSSSDDITELKCDGALDQHGATATLHDLTFELSTTFHTTEASLKRGTKWIVEGVAEGSSHGAPATTATPASGGPAAPANLAKPPPSAHTPPRHDAGTQAPPKAR